MFLVLSSSEGYIRSGPVVNRITYRTVRGNLTEGNIERTDLAITTACPVPAAAPYYKVSRGIRFAVSPPQETGCARLRHRGREIPKTQDRAVLYVATKGACITPISTGCMDTPGHGFSGEHGNETGCEGGHGTAGAQVAGQQKCRRNRSEDGDNEGRWTVTRGRRVL
jgi:hypothetical protein